MPTTELRRLAQLIYHGALSAELAAAARAGAEGRCPSGTCLDAGGDVNDVNDDEDTMLQLSVLFAGGGNLDGDRLRIVKLLLARGQTR